MFGNRVEIECSLKTLTPMHVGTGAIGQANGPAGTNEPINYALIARDKDDMPYILAPSLKGVLRRLAEQYFPSDPAFGALFGMAKNTKSDQGAMGQLLVHAGRFVGPPPDLSSMPYAKSNPELKAAYIAARTSIDAETGVAEDHKLFFQEMVPSGMAFRTPMTFLEFGQFSTDARNLLENLLQIAMRDGLFIGKNQADGQGQLALTDVTLREMVLGKNGALAEKSRKQLTAARIDEFKAQLSQQKEVFRLLSEAPFAIVDSSIKGEGREVAKQEGTVQVSAQRRADGQPLVHGSSISGVLRTRADWLYQLAKKRQAPWVNDDPSPIEELFGAPDFKALLEIRNLKVDNAREEKTTSLKVDRFAGGSVFGALYTTAAFTGTTITFELHLQCRGKLKASKAAAELFKLLVEDVRANGLQLGHGTNKGFGWFKQVEG